MSSQTLAAFPEDWDDIAYLAHYPSVADAVASGAFTSGYAHYLRHGRHENRNAGWVTPANAKLTRGCQDPWSYVEMTPHFGLKPCCKKAPLANYEKGVSTSTLRNNVAFTALRSELLTGDLGVDCRNCHIRPMVSIKHFSEMLGLSPAEALRAQQLRTIRVELTTQCNLRCVYCPVSMPSYKGKDLATENFAAAHSFIANEHKDASIMINGHGETTFHPDWLKFCEPLLQLENPISIITNFARPLMPEEAACLARFRMIQISLDTVDPELLPRLRRKVQLQTIIDNINRVRDAAVGTEPRISFSCGVYDQSIAGMAALCEFAIAHHISTVTFWQLVKYEDIPNALNVYPIPSLPTDDIRAAIRVMDDSVRTLQAANIEVEIAGEFLEEWRKVVHPLCHP